MKTLGKAKKLAKAEKKLAKLKEKEVIRRRSKYALPWIPPYRQWKVCSSHMGRRLCCQALKGLSIFAACLGDGASTRELRVSCGLFLKWYSSL